MKFQSLNNATTIITSGKDKIILDPWVVGHLYQNSWSAFPKTNFDEEDFQNGINTVKIGKIENGPIERPSKNISDTSKPKWIRLLLKSRMSK